MKKLLTLLLSAAALGWATSPASAWWPCFGGKCCSKCCTKICIRPYNAFSPICCGSMCCDGCGPMNMGCCNFGGGMNCCPSTCCVGGGDACCLGQLPAPGTLAAPAAPAATANAPFFQSPLPQPTTYAGPMPWNPYADYNAMVQPAAYQQGMYPQAMYPQAMYGAGMSMMPYGGQVPYYWGPGGR